MCTRKSDHGSLDMLSSGVRHDVVGATRMRD